MVFSRAYYFGFVLSFLNAIPYNEIDAFVEVYETIKNIYLEPIDEKTLIEHAITGMVSRLDPHSAYLISENSENSFLNNDFTGIGIEFSHNGEHLEIMSVLPQSPAQENRLQTHDKILMINDTWTKGLSLEDAAALIKGTVGTPIDLVILRRNEKTPEKISLTREWLDEKTVSYKKIGDLGYLRISRFTNTTTQEVSSALTSENLSGLEGLILDLRNNPGGLVQSASAIANFFLAGDLCEKNYPAFSNKIVYSEGKAPSFNISYCIEGDDRTNQLPLVVLINQGSASASEILAGALQDYHRAVIIGEQSFGKGSVQTVIPIQNNLLKLTCSRYYTPQGRSIQANGISPDIPLYGQWIKSKEESAVNLSEKNLAKHLRGTHTVDRTAASSAWDSIEDPFLIQARGILSALKIEKDKNDPKRPSQRNSGISLKALESPGS